MAYSLFLYTRPFVVYNPKTLEGWISETARITDDERADEQQVREILFKFAVDHSLVSASGNVITNSLKSDAGSWVWLVNWMNFRSLTDKYQYARLMSALQAHDGHPIDLVIDLHTRLGMLFDHRLLNTIVNRTMTSVGIIPYADESEDTVSWETIHKETPFIWVLILLQAVIRSEVKKVV